MLTRRNLLVGAAATVATLTMPQLTKAGPFDPQINFLRSQGKKSGIVRCTGGKICVDGRKLEHINLMMWKEGDLPNDWYVSQFWDGTYCCILDDFWIKYYPELRNVPIPYMNEYTRNYRR